MLRFSTIHYHSTFTQTAKKRIGFDYDVSHIN